MKFLKIKCNTILTHMIVETSSLIWAKEGFSMWSLSVAILNETRDDKINTLMTHEINPSAILNETRDDKINPINDPLTH